MHAVVVGGGIFGVTAARSLRARGLAVTLIDPAPIGTPHPLAESTDISKVIRMDYGADADYTALGEQALASWRQSPLFHETGVTFLSKVPMSGFELASYEMLTSRGHRLERLDANAIADRFPAWRRGAYVDGYFNPQGGWAESGAVVAAWNAEARAAGVMVRSGKVERVVEEGVLLADGELVRGDVVVVAAGSWVPVLVPELAPATRAVGQPVFHLRPADPSLFEAHHFPVFGADISRTGYYGFPVNRDGIVKIANHGTGTLLPACEEVREVNAAQEAALRDMLRDTFPALVDAPIVGRRLCVYCDTADENFWIAPHPARPSLVVATGGSGHAFKFAPVLGDVIASIALGEPHPLAHKFRWRADEQTPHGTEAARHHG
ncbi:MAG TPA: FAD-dependent oxidoreductase [Kofleriaceae bacterium]|nr:FAD-dependent oxidoreductase [Kofleriaceae bacterium]